MKKAFNLILAFNLFILAGCSLLPGSTDYSLAEAGPYHVGWQRMILYKDASREDRAVYLTLWYPAEISPEAFASEPVVDAAPDRSGAPYPLILSSSKVGFIFAQHMVSHGFVVVGLNNHDSKGLWGQWLIDYPLDILFALDQVASQPPQGMEGMIDSGRAGYMGYSFDGYNALAVSGARVDPEYYLSQCSQPSPTLPAWWIEYNCTPASDWEAFAAHAGADLTTSVDGLWQPMTDDRIRAVMPMAPEGAWLFGERGLAAVDRPVLMIGATADTINPYDQEVSFIYDALGTPERALISFIDQIHGMIDDPEMLARLKHFAAAFFGFQLQGKTDYAGYFSEDFVSRHTGLAWGVYAGK